MKISQRLFLGVIPSIVGLFTVAALAYWGQYSNAAPRLVVAAAAIASIVSLIVAWRNTRYVARRVERLAAIRSASGEGDELDVIQHRVEHLGREASTARADAAKATEDAARRADEYARLTSEAAASVSTKLEEARLSLHVLQESHFGELNDNQEEMINAARSGVDAAEVELARLREVADIDRGKVSVTDELVKVSDILRSLLPLLKSRADKKKLRLMVEIEPGLPRVSGDRSRFRDALGLVLNDALTYAIPGTSISIHLASHPSSVKLIVNHGAPHSSTGDLALAHRLVGLHGGSLANENEATVVTFARPTS